MLVKQSEVREVKGITATEKKNIIIFLQGAVYSWCKNRKDEWFAARDLLGGDNFNWKDTPLHILFEKSNDVEQASKDAGWLLKKTINNYKRTFESTKKGLVRHYRWISDNIKITN